MKRLAALLIAVALSGTFLGCQKPAEAPKPQSQPAATAPAQEGGASEQKPQQGEPAGEPAAAAPAEQGSGQAQQ